MSRQDIMTVAGREEPSGDTLLGVFHVPDTLPSTIDVAGRGKGGGGDEPTHVRMQIVLPLLHTRDKITLLLLPRFNFAPKEGTRRIFLGELSAPNHMGGTVAVFVEGTEIVRPLQPPPLAEET